MGVDADGDIVNGSRPEEVVCDSESNGTETGETSRDDRVAIAGLETWGFGSSCEMIGGFFCNGHSGCDMTSTSSSSFVDQSKPRPIDVTPQLLPTLVDLYSNGGPGDSQ